MLKLLRSNLERIIKSKTFWIFFGVYAFYKVLLILFCLPNPNFTVGNHPIEYLLTQNYGLHDYSSFSKAIVFPLQGLLLTIMCCVILGPEFHNSTIKNKLIVGHTRSQIYLSNLIAVALISLALNFVYLLFFFALTLPIYHTQVIAPAKDIFALITCGTLMLLSYSAVITAVMMTCKNSFITMTVSVVLLGLSMLLTYLYNKTLSIPEFVPHPIAGAPTLSFIPNKEYPNKSLRSFCQFMLDFFPSGQSFQLAVNFTSRWQMALSSLSMIGATSGIGMAIFQRSEIK